MFSVYLEPTHRVGQPPCAAQVSAQDSSLYVKDLLSVPFCGHPADNWGPRCRCQYRAAQVSPSTWPSPPPCRGPTGALGGEGCCLAWRLKVGQIGTKSKAKVKQKAHVTTRGERTKPAPPTFATEAGGDRSAGLRPCAAVTARATENLGPGRLAMCWSGPTYVHACQRAVLSESSSESLFSVTGGRSLCSRGLRRSAGPSSTWMEGTSK